MKKKKKNQKLICINVLASHQHVDYKKRFSRNSFCPVIIKANRSI